jgi:Gas vesicle synthesis protein GvpO
MADQRPVREARGDERLARDRRRPHEAADGEGRRPEPRPARRSDSLSANEAAKQGLRQISELTGKRPEGVTELERTDDGWVVGVEVVEDRRIPSSSDILATYEAEFGTSGELVSYRRLQRYSRGQGGPSGTREGG